MSNSSRFKFRVWDNEKKSYSNMIYFISEEGELYGTDNFDMAANDSYYLHETLCDDMFDIEQCTGLKDKNGNLIYEGDIVNNKAYLENGLGYFTGSVSRSEIGGWYCKDIRRDGFVIFDEKFWDTCEIIGNIHEKESK